MSPSEVPEFTNADFILEYLAEGAANIVYHIRPPFPLDDDRQADHQGSPNIDSRSSTPLSSEIDPLTLPPSLNGKLIRLRKTSSTVPVMATQTHFEQMIQPLFPSGNLIQASLFRTAPALLKQCNTDLRSMEAKGTRPAKRRGTYLAEDEAFGTLVTDMSISSNLTSQQTTIEFKPKWLVQSPSAPAGSRRCRTCALRAMKAANRDEPKSKSTFCPLNLVSHDRNKVSIAVNEIYGPPTTDGDWPLRNQLLEFLYRNPLLDRLRHLQLDLDPQGVLKADLMDERFLAAMTLRDCQLFLKIPVSKDDPIEARLGDLDLKTASGKKGEYWRDLERQLIDGGWYAATDDSEYKNTCLLG